MKPSATAVATEATASAASRVDWLAAIVPITALTTRAATPATYPYVNHVSCSRSTPVDRRNRRTRPATQITMRITPSRNPTVDTASPTPLGSVTGSGDGNGAGATSDTTVGASADPTAISPRLTSERATTTRHLRDGTSPSGKTTSRTFASRTKPIDQAQLWSHAAHSTPGSSGSEVRAAYAYAPDPTSSAAPAPIASITHPTEFSGRRDAISAPTSGNASAIPGSGNDSESSGASVTAHSTKAPSATASDRPPTVHAATEVPRRVMGPTPVLGSRRRPARAAPSATRRPATPRTARRGRARPGAGRQRNPARARRRTVGGTAGGR